MHKFKILCFAICAIFFSKYTWCEPPNLARLLKSVQEYHDSGAYNKELTTTIANAHKFILQRITNNLHQPHPQKLAIVLDIDETSLSSYANIVKHNFMKPTKEELHHDIVVANDPAIQPTLDLYKDAQKHQVAVFFVTGRREFERAPTIKNLLKAGYKGWAQLYLKPDQYQDPSNVPFKSNIRKQITEQGYTVIASIGDQYSDLSGGYAERGFKLPNPYYYLP